MNLCKFSGALVNDPLNFGKNENDYIVRVKLLVKSSYLEDVSITCDNVLNIS